MNSGDHFWFKGRSTRKTRLVRVTSTTVTIIKIIIIIIMPPEAVDIQNKLKI